MKAGRKGVLSLIVVLWTFGLYWGALGNGFVGDDALFIVENQALRAPPPLARFFLDPRTQSSDKQQNSYVYRPLATLSEAALFRLSGTSAPLYHLANVLLHAATGCLIFLIVLSFDETRWIEALGAALLFVGHPVNVEAVAWATHLSTLASAFWLYLALLCSLQPAAPVWYEAALAAGLVACGFKESALMFAPLAGLLGWLRKKLKPQEPPRACQSPAFLLMAAALGACFFAWRRLVLGHVAQQPTLSGSSYTDVLLMLKAFGCYLKLLFWPHPLSYHYLFQVPAGPLDALVLLSAAAIAATLALAWLCRSRKPEVTFAVAWLYLGLLPVSNILPIVSLMNERFLYIPCMGFCFLLPRLIGDAARRFKAADPRWRLAPLAAVLLAYAALVRNRLPDWKNNESMTLATLRTCPQSAAPHNVLALDLAEQGRLDDAIFEFTASLAIDPGQMALLKAKDLIPPMSREQLGLWESWGKTLHYRMDFFPVWSNLGQAYLMKKSYEHAVAALERAQELSPRDERVNRNLAAARFAIAAQAPKRGPAELKDMSVENLFFAAGQAHQSWQKRRYLQEIAARAPASAYGYYAAAWLRPDAQTEDKIKDYSSAIALKPDLWEAYVARGSTYKSLNRMPQAAADELEAAQHGQALGQFNMGVLHLFGQGVPQDAQKAVEWFGKAAAQGETNSQVNLGVLYLKGMGVGQDYPLALKWFRKAAEQGNVSAQDYLAIIYEQGLGVPKDRRQAASWYRRAARLGDPQAKKALEGFGEKP